MFSACSQSCHPLPSNMCGNWSTQDFLRAHVAVRESGKYNFEGCRIPIPTRISFEWMKAALGSEISFKELRTLDLIKYGIPINCSPNVGVKRPQKNHYSAISFKEAINDYLNKNVQCQAMLGPFMDSPIADLSFSPLMTVRRRRSRSAESSLISLFPQVSQSTMEFPGPPIWSSRCSSAFPLCSP